MTARRVAPAGMVMRESSEAVAGRGQQEMVTRRSFTKWAGILPVTYLLPGTCGSRPAPDPQQAGLWLNDIHSQLNVTHLRASVRPASLEALQQVVRDAKAQQFSLCIAGGRHGMGGQQFLTDGVIVDMRGMNRIIGFDQARGLIEIGAGIEWPELIDYLEAAQAGAEAKWGIAQKQSGADRLTVGGALAANAHGRGLGMKPIVADIESLTLVDAAAQLRQCSRTQDAELFRLAIGGFGLFGIVASVTLRLAPRQKLERIVEIVAADQLAAKFAERLGAGYRFGDWQFSTDPESDDFLNAGVLSCHRPADAAATVDDSRKPPNDAEWRDQLYLAHSDRKKAWQQRSTRALAASGEIAWSDRQQLAVYVDNYHRDLDAQLGATVPASEMTAEVYVPREALAGFLAETREDFRQNAVALIDGSVRLIEADDESFLAWARQPWACLSCDLHVVHDDVGLAKAGDDIRRLMDRALKHGGSFSLAYHRWANRAEVEAAYPAFAEFLRLKRQYDAEERFQSDWYRHYRTLFAAAT